MGNFQSSADQPQQEQPQTPGEQWFVYITLDDAPLTFAGRLESREPASSVEKSLQGHPTPAPCKTRRRHPTPKPCPISPSQPLLLVPGSLPEPVIARAACGIQAWHQDEASSPQSGTPATPYAEAPQAPSEQRQLPGLSACVLTAVTPERKWQRRRTCALESGDLSGVHGSGVLVSSRRRTSPE